MPNWHCDKIVHAIETLDIGIIQDEMNVEEPDRVPQADVLMGNDLVIAFEKIHGKDIVHTNDSPNSFPMLIVRLRDHLERPLLPGQEWYHWLKSKS